MTRQGVSVILQIMIDCSPTTKGVVNWLRVVDVPNNGFSSCHPVNDYKRRARVQTITAIKWGEIVLYGECRDCGSKQQIEKHHVDYSNHLDIVELCMLCHKKRHRRRMENVAIDNN